jgi:two-component system response regulator AtoC
VDIRFVAATHKDLEDMIADKLFREDLFFRLNVITIELPALRERREDIVPLAQFFLDRFRREHKREVCRFSSQAITALRNWDWPGNIRELRNAIERALLIEADDVIDAEHLHLWRRRGSTAIENANAVAAANGNGGSRTRIGYDFEIPDDGFSIVEFEKVLLSRALHKARHNVSRAARLLGLSRETMRYRIKKHLLEDIE